MISWRQHTATETDMHSSGTSLSASNSTWIAHDWQRFGADAIGQNPYSVQEASHYCKKLAESHYENFSVASWLLPKSLRRHFQHVYAYCRWSDDLADQSPDPKEALRRLDWWQSELNDCFLGKAKHPVMIALTETIREYQLQQKPFDDLLSAFRQDQSITRYDSDSQLIDYCQRSANPVGRILLSLAKVGEAECLAWSDDICTGLQLANFCQDVSRDAEIARIYLPKERWNQYQIDEAMILKRVATPALKKTILKWCSDIARYFERGWPLADRVPSWLGRDVRLFASAGLKVLEEIGAIHGDVWTKRPEVGKWSKFSLLLRSLITSKPPPKVNYFDCDRNRSSLSE
jgi:squalene synthase HpnC